MINDICNRSVLKEVMDMVYAEAIINMLLYNKKILFKISDKIKRR